MWKFILVFVLLAVNFGYWYWTTTPFYSILQIKDSIANHDLKSFEEYVDVERVSSNMIDGFLTPQVRSKLSKGVLGDMLGTSLIYLIKPTLMDVIKEEVSHFVEKNQIYAKRVGSNQAPNQAFRKVARARHKSEVESAPAIGRTNPAVKQPIQLETYETVGPHGERVLAIRVPPRPTEQTKSNQSSNDSLEIADLSMKGFTGKLGFGKNSFKRVAFIRIRKSDATIGVMLHNDRYDIDMLLELKMERVEDHWRLVEVSNFASFVYLIIAHEEARREHMNP